MNYVKDLDLIPSFIRQRNGQDPSENIYLQWKDKDDVS